MATGKHDGICLIVVALQSGEIVDPLKQEIEEEKKSACSLTKQARILSFGAVREPPSRRHPGRYYGP